MGERLIRMCRQGRFQREGELIKTLEGHGLSDDQNFGGPPDTYHAIQIDRPRYYDVLIELQGKSIDKADAIIRDLRALGFEEGDASDWIGETEGTA
jgi:hypothetical protein